MLVVYYSVLLLFLIASFFPQYRVWGFNWWAYYPIWVPFVLFAVGAVVPLLLRFVPRRETSEKKTGRYFLFAAGLVVVFGLAFYFLRARTHFLGDGYTLLSLLAADNPLVKPRELGESLVHIWVKNLIGGDGETAALLSYRIISITAGVLFLTTVAVFSKFLFERTRERLLFLLGLASGGYMLLFFGYVENYSLFVFAVTLYALTGLLVVKGKLGRWLILPPLGLSIFFHILGVTLIPSAVYLLVIGTRVGDALAKLRTRVKLLVGVTAATVVLMVFYHFYTTDYFFRFAFVPLFKDRFTVEGYTLLSFKHIVDYLNLLILLLPGLPIVVVTLFYLPPPSILKQREYRYLLILLASTLGAIFIFDPKLGMPRDWDLFAFAGVPLVLFGYYFVINCCRIRLRRTPVAMTLILLGLISLFPRVMSQVVAEVSIDHFRHYADMDKIKNRTSRPTLIKYYSDAGETEKAQLETKRWEADFPEIRLRDSAFGLVNTNPQEAAVLCRRVLEINPLYSDAWANLGVCYMNLQKYDSALTCLEIADGLNPYNPIFHSNMAFVYFYQKDYRRAEKLWFELLERDSLMLGPLVGLARLYSEIGDQKRYAKYFAKVAPRDDAPLDFVKALGNYYLGQRQFEKAAQTYQRALRLGLDSSFIETLSQRYPQLKGVPKK